MECDSFYILYQNPQIPNFSTKYFVMCKVYTGYYGTSEIEQTFYLSHEAPSL